MKKNNLLLECLFLFGLFPAVLSANKPHSAIYLIMWGLTALAIYALRRRHGWRFYADWNIEALDRAFWRRMLLRFIPFAIALLIFSALVLPPERFLNLPRQRLQMMVGLCIFYPLLSALPQEILFRSYFFRRYAHVFTTERSMILASALAFGWMHVLLQNWVAVSFSFLGGLLFSDTYRRTKSLAAACAEHALYGCYIFMLGLGLFFYHGAAVR